MAVLINNSAQNRSNMISCVFDDGYFLLESVTWSQLDDCSNFLCLLSFLDSLY